MSRICAHCSKPFVMPTGRGRARVYCERKCAKAARKAKHLALAAPCTVPGCHRKSRQIAAGPCEAHYMRVRRAGTVHIRDPRITGRTVTKAGYVLLRKPDHPLANSAGWVAEHRIVAFEVYGSGPQTCHWCGCGPLPWQRVTVDHLNERKADNGPENLVPSCNPCNRARGSFISFMARLQPARLEQLFQTLRAMNRPPEAI